METWTRYDKKYDAEGKAIYKDAMDGKSKPDDANATKQSILAIDMDDEETRNSHKVSRKKQKTVKKSQAKQRKAKKQRKLEQSEATQSNGKQSNVKQSQTNKN